MSRAKDKKRAEAGYFFRNGAGIRGVYTGLLTGNGSLLKELGSPPLKPMDWLWCLHCERFFQAKDLRPDDIGGSEGCSFLDCDGAGYGIDIFDWDDWTRQNELKHWPKSKSELKRGLRCPLYPGRNGRVKG